MEWKKTVRVGRISKNNMHPHEKHLALLLHEAAACVMGLKSNLSRLEQSGVCLSPTSPHHAGCFLFSVLCSLAQPSQSPACSSLSNQKYCLLSGLFSPVTHSPQPHCEDLGCLTPLEETPLYFWLHSRVCRQVHSGDWQVLVRTDSDHQGDCTRVCFALHSVKLKAGLQQTS